MKQPSLGWPLVHGRERRPPAFGHALCERPSTSNCSGPSKRNGDSKRDRITPEFAYGWNAGFSERAGVGLVATTLVARRQRDLTIDDIHRAAKAAGASPNLSNPAKVRFAKAVTAQYLRERTRDESEGYAVPLVAVGDAGAAAASPVASPAQVEAQPAGVS